MYPELNPFAPGAGRNPPNLVGRGREVDDFDLIIARSRRGLISRPIAVHGLRGVGKTVLLRRFQRHASTAGWSTLWIEGSLQHDDRRSARDRLARDFVGLGHRLASPKRLTAAVKQALASIDRVTVGLPGVASVIVDPSPGATPASRLRFDLEDLATDLGPALLERETALAIFVDEMQDLDDDLASALLSMQHRATQLELPIYLFGAGLPSLPGRLARARSYAERLMDFRELGSLSDRDARDAVALPAIERGMTFTASALDAIVTAAEGYPYFLQLFAERAWNLATSRTIAHDEARLAIELGWSDLDDGFFPARWDRATDLERRYLSAIAEAPGSPTPTAWIAERLATPAANLTAVRRALIEKGILFSPARGMVAFSVPGMSGHVDRRRRGDLGFALDRAE
jgi:hypothetical protein